MTFAQLVKELRLERKLTQEELAKISGVSLAQISHIETGRRKRVGLLTLAKLDKALRAKGQLFEFFRNAPI